MPRACLPRLQYGLYQILWGLAALPLLLAIGWRYRHHKPHTRRLGERMGCFKKNGWQPRVWLHLASVGEVKGALPLLKQLLKDYSTDELLLTTTTPTGEAILRASLGDTVHHHYLPFDLAWLMGKFIRRYRPRTLMLFETELWPAMLLESSKAGLDILLVNARLSSKSSNNYSRFPGLANAIFNRLTLVVAQTVEDADNFNNLGAANVVVSGNIKLDLAIDPTLRTEAKNLHRQWLLSSTKKILIAASTHRGEEEMVLNAFVKVQRRHPHTLLLLAPRHPERIKEIHSLCRHYPLKTANRSDPSPIAADTDVILGDTVGELLLLFGVGDLAIMGGTLINHGGHNFLEPAAWGLPIVSGKSDYNFKAIAAGLVKAGGLIQVAGVAELAAAVADLIADDGKRREQGRAAQQYVRDNRGALQRLMAAVRPYIHFSDN